MAKPEILEEEPARQYLEFVGPNFTKERRHFPLAFILRTALEDTGCDSLTEFLEFCRKNNDQLHIVFQRIINKLSENRAPKTVSFYMYLLFDFLKFHRIKLEEAKQQLKMPKGTVRIDRLPTLAEVQRLILASRSPRMRLLIQLLLQTGMRVSEALSLRVADIDFDAKVIRIRGAATKTKAAREVPLIPELEAAIKDYLNRRKVDSVWLFPNLKDPSRPVSRGKMMRSFFNLLQRYRLAPRDPSGRGYQIHFHVFRKWYKTMLERAGVNRLLIERWMGHTIGVQGVYYLPTPEDEERERQKAAEALRIFGKIEQPKPQLPEPIEKALAKQALLSLWAIEDELLKVRLLAFMKRKKDVLAKIDQDLEVLRERMTEFTSKLTRKELEELERIYAGVSDEENEKNITSSDRKARVKRASLVGDGNPRSRRKNG
jgi:integrase/recombinase XerD